ncbi:MAG: serine hydrolase, partial [Ilumatobacteraceae bacterium]
LNFEAANSTRAVLATIALGPDGAFRLQANVSTQVIVDVLGYFTGSSAPVARAGLFVPLVPTREFDTRETGNRLVAGGSITIRYALDPLAVLGNVVITDDRHAGFATVTPGASPSTATSSVNTDRANQSIAAAVVSAYIAGAGVTISTQQAAHLVFDIAGVYVTESGDAPAPVPSSVSLGTRESVDPFAGLTPAGLLARYGDATSTHAAVMTSDGVIHSFGETDVALPTASTIKALVMGCTFARFQDRGRSTLDGSTQALVQAMISVSDNDATTSLVNALGGTSGLLACGRRFGATTMIMSDKGWGVTQISPESFVTILRNVLRPESSVLNAGWVTQARMMMNSSNIAPDERWGVGAGRPAGSTYWVKNGWWTTAPGDFRYPGSRINSVGMVESGNEWWIIAIQGDRYSSQYRGIGATQLIASTVNANLANA